MIACPECLKPSRVVRTDYAERIRECPACKCRFWTLEMVQAVLPDSARLKLAVRADYSVGGISRKALARKYDVPVGRIDNWLRPPKPSPDSSDS